MHLTNFANLTPTWRRTLFANPSPADSCSRLSPVAVILCKLRRKKELNGRPSRATPRPRPQSKQVPPPRPRGATAQSDRSGQTPCGRIHFAVKVGRRPLYLKLMNSAYTTPYDCAPCGAPETAVMTHGDQTPRAGLSVPTSEANGFTSN